MNTDNKEKYTKWVACWGTATSITERKEAIYAKDLTLQYPIKMAFSGSSLRLHLSNLTGSEAVEITKTFLLHNGKAHEVFFAGEKTARIEAGKDILSDEIELEVKRGDEVTVSFYLGSFTQMNAGTLLSGPRSKGAYAYGDFATVHFSDIPSDKKRNTNWFYFLNTLDILTEEKNFALICYGDSITAQSWTDYLSIRCEDEGFSHIAVIRRAVCGTRILRQYDCLTYQAYGLKGSTRFPLEMQTAGAKALIIQHGINDIIHPVGVETNIFRPWSDMPTSQDLIEGVKNIYIKTARELGLKVYSGTLLPIYQWRTYADFRDKIRNEFNEYLRTSSDFDGCVDFDKAVRDEKSPFMFKEGFDSGDHLHPSESAYKAMAQAVPSSILGEKS